MNRIVDVDEVLGLFGIGDEDFYAKGTIEDALYDGSLKTIELTQRTGKWVEVSGYATPGGDPVWCCSECGKGLHVYGIEHGTYGEDVADGQWVACPNCGAVMGKVEQE